MLNKKEVNILYIDDDAMSREIMEFILKKIMGLPHLHFFEDSKDFMKRLQELPAIPDVIFLDIQIYPTDGYEILRTIREDDQYSQTKIIAMTANVMSHDVSKLQKSGFDSLIGKPIMHNVFPEIFGRILSGESIWYIP
jgi:CheY-like chemotaxis protein